MLLDTSSDLLWYAEVSPLLLVTVQLDDVVDLAQFHDCVDLCSDLWISVEVGEDE